MLPAELLHVGLGGGLGLETLPCLADLPRHSRAHYPWLRWKEVDRTCAVGEIEPSRHTVVADLPSVVLHVRELGHVEATEPPVGVGLSICKLGDPCPPPPLPDPEVGLRRLSGSGEDVEDLEPA